MTTNKYRSTRCHRVLETYADGDDASTGLVDLLADARHWCDRHGENYAELDHRAYEHYLAEVVEGRRRPK